MVQLFAVDASLFSGDLYIVVAPNGPDSWVSYNRDRRAIPPGT